MIVTALALVIVGLAMMFIGLLMRRKRLKMGSSWGFRNEETMSSEAIWKRSHVAGGWTIMMAGLGGEIGGIILLFLSAASMTAQTVIVICTLAWIVMMYMGARSKVSEAAQRMNL